MAELKKHETPQDAEDFILGAFAEAVKTGKWYMAVWGLEENGDLTFRRTACNFPINRMISVLEDLKGSVLEEVNNELSIKQPLPLAPHVSRKNRNGEEIDRVPMKSLHEVEEIEYVKCPECNRDVPDHAVNCKHYLEYNSAESVKKRQEDFNKEIEEYIGTDQHSQDEEHNEENN